MTIRVGGRGPGLWYAGGAYAFSRHDANNLVRLPILQQLRAEARYYLSHQYRINPFLSMAAGGVVYGNEWSVDTGGPTVAGGIGIEIETGQHSVFLASASYRTLFLRNWRDDTGTLRADGPFGFGGAQMLGLELSFEVRKQLSRL